MSISDEEFAEWLKQDNRDRVVLVEVDYKYESGGAPATDTIRVANKVYFDVDAGTTYDDVLLAAPRFARALSGERLGNYELTLGSVEIANADGTYDSLLTRAVDGNEVRAYLGDRGWARADFRLVFSARATIPVAPQTSRISIQLRDASALFNKSVAGTSTVGGTGPHKDRLRPVNFGFVHQAECLVLDEGTLSFVHSDTGTDTYVNAVRDRGIEVSFIDNGDGTITLSAAPDGAIAADVLAVSSDDPGDFTYRRVSDAFKALIGERAGFIAAGKYLGAHFTFIEGDGDDYLVGVSLPEARNVVELLNSLVDTGNCFWAMTREGKFTFGRLNPHDIESLLGSPLAVVDIEKDDIDHGTLRVEHASTKYYKFQAYMSKNWLLTPDGLASSLTPEERALRARKGLYYMQPETEGTAYADAPQLYSLSLEVSPPIETYLSAGYAEEELPVIERWALQRKLMFQPWIETISCTVGIEFYALELGDVVRLTLDRFSADAPNQSSLLQVVGVDIRLTEAKVGLQLMRRRASGLIPDDFEFVFVEDDEIETGLLVPILPPPGEPPILPPPGIEGEPFYPGNLSNFWFPSGVPITPRILLAGNDNFSVIKSLDGGVTWSAEIPVFSSGFGTVVGLIQLANGRILALSSEGLMASSADEGESWNEYTSPIPVDSPAGVYFNNSKGWITYDGNESVAFTVLEGLGTDDANIYVSVANGDEGTWTREVHDLGDGGLGNSEGPMPHIAYTFGQWFAARFGNGIAPADYYYTSDPTGWNHGTFSGGFRPAAYCATSLGDFVAVSDFAGSNTVSFSNGNGGATWSSAVAITGFPKRLAIASLNYLNGVYLIETLDTDNLDRALWRSTDGIAYTQTYAFATGDGTMFVTTVEDTFYVGIYKPDGNSTSIIVSTNGTDWSAEQPVQSGLAQDQISNYLEVLISLQPGSSGTSTPSQGTLVVAGAAPTVA